MPPPFPPLLRGLTSAALNYEGFHAIYCHEWDPSGLKLLAGGGPLQYGLRGCYTALWQ